MMGLQSRISDIFTSMNILGGNLPGTPSLVQPPPTTPEDLPTSGSPEPQQENPIREPGHGTDIEYTPNSSHHADEPRQEAKEAKEVARQSSKQKPRRGNLSRKRRIFRYEFHPRLILENNGSVARDHLASERTFLAYVRTSLALATTGVALVQLFTVAAQSPSSGPVSPQVQKFAQPLGATLVVFSFLVLIVGVYRYFVNQKALIQGRFTVARVSVSVITFILFAITIIVFAVLVAGR